MAARPGIAGELLGAGGAVEDFLEVVDGLLDDVLGVVDGLLVDVLSVVLLVEVTAVVGSGSSLTVPITQYDLLVSRPGQLIPGLTFLRSSTDIPQLSAKLAQVSPLPGGIEKAQSTARRDRVTVLAKTIPGKSPAAARRRVKCIPCILKNYGNTRST